jgi:hypothetical protein
MSIEKVMYRLYTQDVNRDKITEIVAAHFKGFTIFPISGSYEGVQEDSILIEIETADYAKVLQVAGEIRELNNQDEVLIVAARRSMSSVVRTFVTKAEAAKAGRL